ncbi:MAG: hypothetical protein ACM3SQ_04280 [Betaproteobacteria bacterium]
MQPSRAIAGGTLVVGTLDLLDAVVFFGIRNGVPPVRILQSIASGWLGRAAFRGGPAVATLGLATHYFIAFAIVLTYLAASRKLDVLARRPWICGPAYGLAVYLVMYLIVLPLSAAGPQRFVPAVVANELLVHMFGVGTPSALFAAAARLRRKA